jgi:beta-glucosidase
MITISPESAPASSHSVSLPQDAGTLIAREKFAAAANAPDRQFPATFAWGVATAAPQIEGASTLDGKGPSVWDKFCREPGKVLNGDTLDVACEHYTRFKDDFAIFPQDGENLTPKESIFMTV